MHIASTDRKLIASLAALVVLCFGLEAQAQFTAPTCVPPNCSPAVIQNIPLAGTTQTAGINISGSAKLGATVIAGAAAPVLTLATDNLIYGNVGATSVNGSLLLLQFGAADRLRVSLAGQLQLPLGTVALPSYTFLGDTNTGIYSPAADQIGFSIGGSQRELINNGGVTIPAGQLAVSVGSALAPTIVFVGDLNTGIYHSAADTLNFSTNGANRLQIDPVGTVTIPGNLNVSGTITGGGLVSANGASNYVTKFTGASALGVSQLYDDANSVLLGQGLQMSSMISAGDSFQRFSLGYGIVWNDSAANYKVTDPTYNQQTFSDENGTFVWTQHSGALSDPQTYAGWHANDRMTLDTGGNLNLVTGNLILSNGLIAGNGSGLNSLNASNLSTGTLPSAVFAGTYANAVTFNNAANSFTGNGAGLTGISASGITTGTLPDAQLSANIARLNAIQTFSAANTFSSASNSFTGVGTGLTALNGTNVTSGTVADTRLSANIPKLNAANTFTGNNILSGATTLGSASRVNAAGQNLAYGLISSSSTGGNFLLFEKGAGVPKFSVDFNGNTTVGGNLNVTGTITGSVTEADTLQSVTTRGSTTTTGMNLGGNLSTAGNFTATGMVTLGEIQTSPWILGRTLGANQNLIYGVADHNSSDPSADLILLQTSDPDGSYDTKFAVSKDGNASVAGSFFAPNGLSGGYSGQFNVNNVGDVSAGNMYSNGQAVCLANGTNCPPATVSGTAGRVTRFATATTLGNSVIQDNGSTVAIGNAPAAGALLVVGPTALSNAIIGTTNGANSVGVYGFGVGSNSTGLYGQGTVGGVVGISTTAGGVGVQATGQLYGVSGTVNTSNGMGVFGSVPNNSIGYGVYGASGSNQFTSAGVAGNGNNNAMGGYFQANTVNIYALMAYNGAGGNAFQAQGSSNFTGPVTMNSTLALSGTLRLASYNGAPPGSTGMMYFDTTVGKMKCYESSWVNCIGAASTLDAVLTAGNTSTKTLSTGALTVTSVGADAITAVPAAGYVGFATAGGVAGVKASGLTEGGHFSTTGTYGVYAANTGSTASTYALYATAAGGTGAEGAKIIGNGSNLALEVAGGDSTFTGVMAVGGAALNSSYGLSVQGSNYGVSAVSTGGGYGVYGTGQIGVGGQGGQYGLSGNGSLYGVYGQTGGTNAVAVFGNGWGTNSYGVEGVANGSGGTGVVAMQSSGSYALQAIGTAYFSGDIQANNNSWGNGDGWHYCSLNSGSWSYCTCANGTFVGNVAFLNLSASGAATYCYRP